MADDVFLDLIQKVRVGDSEATRELFETYGSQIRRMVRVRLTNSGLRRFMDSQDICQSVMANFFARASAGQFELETPSQLFKLLVTMARNRLTNKAQYYHAGRRDIRRTGGDELVEHAAGPDATPSVVLGRAELVDRFRSLLTDEERRLLDLRSEGRTWAEIATELDDSPERLRKRLERTLQRIATNLGYDADGDARR